MSDEEQNNEESSEQELLWRDKWAAEREIARIRSEISAEVDRFRLQVESRFTDQLQAQKNIIKNAEDKLTALRDAENEISAERNSSHPLVGVRVEQVRSVFGGRDEKATGVLGVVEVFRKGDALIEGKVSGIPEVGELIVRVLKRDGSKSRKVDRCREVAVGEFQLPWGWRKIKDEKASGK